MTGCTSTSALVDDALVTDTSLALDEKLTLLGFPEVHISAPQAFFDGKAWMLRLMEILENAEDYVILTSYLASESESNREFYDLLIRRAGEGLKIYLLMDSSSTFDMTRSREYVRPLMKLREHGIHVLEFNPFSINRAITPSRLFLRDHRKVLVADGLYVAVGGMNINHASTLGLSEGPMAQRDSMFLMQSSSLAQLFVSQFIEFWNSYSWESVDESTFAYRAEGAGEAQDIRAFFINQDDPSSGADVKFLGSVLSSAREEILVLPFAPLEDENTFEAMENAVKRGVGIRMLLTNEPREGLRNASYYAATRLLENGVELYYEPDVEERQTLLHEKLMIIDNRWVMVGSFNLNYRSLVLANETILLVDSPEFAAFMKQHFEEVLDGSIYVDEQTAEQWKKLSNDLAYMLKRMMG